MSVETDTLTSAILSGIPMPALMIGPDQRIASINKRAAEILGPGGLRRHYLTVMRQPAILDCIEGTLRHGQPSETRQVLLNAGQEATYNVRVAPVLGQGVLVTFEDISDLEQAGHMRAGHGGSGN